MAGSGIARKWTELRGEHHWNGLLDPLDLDLRRALLLYGDMIQSLYDAFNSEPASPNAGTSRFARKKLFDRVELSSPSQFPYKVTKYIYSTAPNDQIARPFFIEPSSTDTRSTVTNFHGLVAVATDEGKMILGRRDIVVAWRGSVTDSDWTEDYDVELVPAKGIAPLSTSPKVHRGFLSVYTTANPKPNTVFPSESARDQVRKEVARMLEFYKGEEVSITITGHSMGASLATLAAYDIAQNVAANIPVTGFAFASTRVGDANFKKVFEGLDNLRLLRMVNEKDVVPEFPSTNLNYDDIGDVLFLRSERSPYLKVSKYQSGRQIYNHNLQLYLHTVAGEQGSKGGFELVVERDLNLVNRDEDALKDEYHVPKEWWVVGNRGMKQDPDGRWKLDDREDDLSDDDSGIGIKDWLVARVNACVHACIGKKIMAFLED